MTGGRVRMIAGWSALIVLLGAAFARAVCGHEPFPWWDADPFAFAPPIVGITPVWALALNVMIVLAGAGVVAATRAGPGPVGSVLLALGLAAVGWHAASDLETVADGSTLAAGIAALVGAWAGSTLPGARRVIVGLALGYGVMLAVVGAQQAYIEHPRTVEAFQENALAFYQAKGWDPAGPEAAMYEERLSHPQPTAWFGLTNVLATFAGAGAAGLIALALAGRDNGGPRWVRLAFVAGAVASAWTLVITGSKGAIGATALAGLVVAVCWARTRAWTGRAIFAAAVLVVVAVAARGVVGERIGELSLLFRSQYQQGTLAVWAEHPLIGVGPGNFQDAYTRLKPIRAPEEVSSPHSVGFDWVGVLGLGGLAWIGLTAAGFCRRAEPEAGEPDDPTSSAPPAPPASPPAPAARTLIRISIALVGAAVIASAMAGRAAMSPEGALALLIGGVGWALVAGLACVVPGSVRAAALTAGAVALVHGQLDVAPVLIGSAPAWGLLVGAAIGSLRISPPVRRAAWPSWASAGSLAAVAAVLAARTPSIGAWESGLDRAAVWPRMIAEARLDLDAGISGGDPMRVGLAAERIGGWLGGRVPPDPVTVRRALDEAVMRSQESALEGLRDAVAARPGHIGTRSALGRVLVTIANRDAEERPQASRAAWEEAMAVAEGGVEARPTDPGAWAWAGAVQEARARLEPGAAATWLGRAAETWIRGDPLTPHAPSSAARIAEALAGAGRAEEAADWAVRALARDDGLDIDPRRRLSTARRATLERIARAEAGATGSETPAGVGGRPDVP